MGILSVYEATKYIKQLFDRDKKLALLYIQGEISNYKRHSSGHCYFTLKDSEAIIRAVMFKSRAQFLKFEPYNGMKVIAGGRVTVFERDGQYQLYIDQMVPQGIGELSLAFVQLKEKLAKEGLFDDARKRPLPLLPKAIGIITSPTGAAVRDIISVAKRRHPGIRIVLYPVQVQGIDAPAQIVQAIQVFNSVGKMDVIIIGRGGGAIEELWAFNDETVVRAVAESAIPTVSAVGHQTDYTLTDFAADVRAATPSQAAEIVVPDIKDLIRYIRSLTNTLENSIITRLRKHRVRVEHCLESKIFINPKDFLITQQQIIDSLHTRMEDSLVRSIAEKRYQFRVLAEKMTALNPLAVLERGYGIVQNKQKKLIRSTNETSLGEKLTVILHKGNLSVEVIEMGETGIGKAKKQ